MYRSTNDYQRKARSIEDSYQKMSEFDDLIKYGMGKQALRNVFGWLNEMHKINLCQKDILSVMKKEDIPEELVVFFEKLSLKRNGS